MASSLWYHYLRENINLNFVAGLYCVLPPWFGQMPKYLRYAWHGYENILYIFGAFATYTGSAAAVFSTDIVAFIASLPTVVHGGQQIVRIVIVKYRRHLTQRFLRDMNEILHETEHNPISKVPLLENQKWHFRFNIIATRVLCISLMSGAFCFLTPTFVQMFLNRDEAKPVIPGWFPYDVKVYPYLEITNVVQLVYGLMAIFRATACDSFLQSLIVLQTSQFRYLKFLMQELCEGEDDTKSHDNIAFGRKLKWWIQQHQRNLSTSKILKDIYSPLYLVVYVELIICMCVLAFLTTLKSQVLTPFQTFSAFSMLLCLFLQLYLMSWLGDRIEDESSSVAETAYTVKTLSLPREITENMKMIFRCQTPVRLTAYNIIALNSRSYRSAMQGVYTYYMALRQVQIKHF